MNDLGRPQLNTKRGMNDWLRTSAEHQRSRGSSAIKLSASAAADKKVTAPGVGLSITAGRAEEARRGQSPCREILFTGKNLSGSLSAGPPHQSRRALSPLPFGRGPEPFAARRRVGIADVSLRAVEWARGLFRTTGTGPHRGAPSGWRRLGESHGMLGRLRGEPCYERAPADASGDVAAEDWRSCGARGGVLDSARWALRLARAVEKIAARNAPGGRST